MALALLFFVIFMVCYWTWVFKNGPKDLRLVAVIAGVTTVCSLGVMDLVLWTQ